MDTFCNEKSDVDRVESLEMSKRLSSDLGHYK